MALPKRTRMPRRHNVVADMMEGNPIITEKTTVEQADMIQRHIEDEGSQ
jgi:hypothetical protein